MKRSMASESNLKNKKVKFEDEDKEEEFDRENNESGFSKLDENLLYEVLKHADARTLAVSSCVSKTWHRTALDERLWELICTRQCANMNCGTAQLRSVVLALGGFRRLHALYLSKTAARGVSSAPHAPPLSLVPQSKSSNSNKRWGKDEVHLSLSLLSIRTYYEKMNFTNRTK